MVQYILTTYFFQDIGHMNAILLMLLPGLLVFLEGPFMTCEPAKLPAMSIASERLNKIGEEEELEGLY